MISEHPVGATCRVKRRQRINLLACEPVDNSGEHPIIVVSSESYVRLIIHTLCASFAADTVYRDLPAFLSLKPLRNKATAANDQNQDMVPSPQP
jgi:hypothetical protein